jgi:hypothetical protein
MKESKFETFFLLKQKVNIKKHACYYENYILKFKATCTVFASIT